MTPSNLEPRSDIDLKRLRTRLQSERDRLVKQLHDLEGAGMAQTQSEELGETADYDQHPADVATDTFFRERDEAIAEGLRGELSQVEAALQKLQDGSYGYCERCSKPIHPERLKALPYALMCMECASLIEGAG